MSLKTYITLNTHAEIIPIANGEVDLDAVLGTGRFDFEKASRAPGWMRELRGESTPRRPRSTESAASSAAHGVPFTPGRLWDVISTGWEGVLRAKGLIWLASRHDMVGMWSQAGMPISFDPGRRRYAAVPKEDRHKPSYFKRGPTGRCRHTADGANVFS